MISKLRTNLNSRASYIRAKLSVLVPSQIRALRLKSNMLRQADLARAANMHQSRISMFETPGAANMTIETLSRLAATFRVGLIIEFVSFSEMLQWENSFSQDLFDVTRIEHDRDFLRGASRTRLRRKRRAPPYAETVQTFRTGEVLHIQRMTEGQRTLPFEPTPAVTLVNPFRIKEHQTKTGQWNESWNAVIPSGGLYVRQRYGFAETNITAQPAVG